MSMTTSVRRAARTASNSQALEMLTRFGLIGYGILHLAVGWLALQIATGAAEGEGDQSGAFQLLSRQPLGRIVVWGIAVGLVAMAVWQLFEAAVGHTDERGGRRVLERVVSAFRTVIYAALAFTAYKVVNGAATSNAQQQRSATGGLLSHAGGTWLVGGLGALVTVVGLVIAWYGVTKGFERHLKRSQMSARTRRIAAGTGQVGYAVKGVVYAVVGILLIIAAVTYDPKGSTGLDGALRTLAHQPFGFALSLVVAAGFAIFGVFCFFQSRFRKV